MAYCTLTDLQARIPARGGQTAFQPLTDGQAQAIVDGVAATIDGLLAGWGFTAPVTTPTVAVDYLKAVNVWGAAAEVLKALFRGSSGPNSETAWGYFQDMYLRALDNLEAWATGALGSSAGILPSSYTTLNPDTDVSLGANAEPLLGARMEW